jgi:hypothetical protein
MKQTALMIEIVVNLNHDKESAVAAESQRLLANSTYSHPSSHEVLGWVFGVIGVIVVIQTFTFANVAHSNEDHSRFSVDAVADAANVLLTPSRPAV